jgi:threonine dehydratase
MDPWPVRFEDLEAARQRLRPFLAPSPLRTYPVLDGAVGHGIGVYVKHENHLPTGSFKVRNALSVLTALDPEQRRRGVVAASRGNHGQGLAWAGRRLGVPVVVCVPVGNNPEKNEAIRGWGAELVEEGADYDAAVAVADRLARDRGLRVVHSTNEPLVVAGAGTLAVELLEEEPGIEGLVVAVGGGSQAVGALVAAQRLKPGLPVYGVQAARASAIHDSWHAKRRLTTASADTFADGLATRQTYETTFPALLEGLAGFVTVNEEELADAVRLLLRATHNLADGAGAAGLAGLLNLRNPLAGKKIAVILSGANLDTPTLTRLLR